MGLSGNSSIGALKNGEAKRSWFYGDKWRGQMGIQSLSGIDRSSQVLNQVIVEIGMPVGNDIYHHKANRLVQK